MIFYRKRVAVFGIVRKAAARFSSKSIPCLFCTVNDKTGELYFLFGGGECDGNLEKIAVNADFEAAAHKLSQA